MQFTQRDLNTYVLLLSKLVPQLQQVSQRQMLEDDMNWDDDEDDIQAYDNQVRTKFIM